ncbi:Gp153 [Mycolicibacterium aurum]|uniref:Gp153 n=1 Tax=Mycolicibacterium aurum TaxID=1791 RepID=A0A3S4VWL6_MYCAU|nr:AAA family ATPase [Mycolicibacterium aurum]VEG57132.1 Gp153 [Mycolicibacterium aurum]
MEFDEGTVTKSIADIANNAEAWRRYNEENALSLLNLGADEQLKDGLAFIDEADNARALWGKGDEILWGEQQPLLLFGPQGVGKTTDIQQLILARAGLRDPELHGYPVEPDDRPIFYLALDRPMQIAASMQRMVDDLGPRDRRKLKRKLRFWKGHLHFKMDQAPDAFAKWVALHGRDPGILCIDSVKDACSGLLSDEHGMGFNDAVQRIIASGTEVVSNHHPRKGGKGDDAKPARLSDVYGSTWITAGHGSVLLLWAEPGAKTVEVSQLKPIREPMRPVFISREHGTGVSATFDPKDLIVDLAVDRGEDGFTIGDAVFAVHGQTDNFPAASGRLRHHLKTLVMQGVLRYEKGKGGGSGGGAIPARWWLT